MVKPVQKLKIFLKHIALCRVHSMGSLDGSLKIQSFFDKLCCAKK
jgi:hypothetical protein